MIRFNPLRKAAGILAAATLLSGSAFAAGDVTLSAEVLGTPSFAPGTEFTVRLTVTENTTGETPIGGAVVVTYDNAHVELPTTIEDTGGTYSAAGDLGDLIVGSRNVVAGTIVDQSVATVSNFSNIVDTPVFGDITFIVDAAPTYPFTIGLMFDPGSGPLYNALFENILDVADTVTVDDSGLEDLDFPFASVDQWMLME